MKSKTDQVDFLDYKSIFEIRKRALVKIEMYSVLLMALDPVGTTMTERNKFPI